MLKKKTDIKICIYDFLIDKFKTLNNEVSCNTYRINNN